MKLEKLLHDFILNFMKNDKGFHWVSWKFVDSLKNMEDFRFYPWSVNVWCSAPNRFFMFFMEMKLRKFLFDIVLPVFILMDVLLARGLGSKLVSHEECSSC